MVSTSTHFNKKTSPRPRFFPSALFPVLTPFWWSSGEILPAAIDVKALVSVQQFCCSRTAEQRPRLDGSLREMCMVSSISKVVVWLAQSRIRASSQRGWWCLDQACSVIADFSVSPLLVAAWCSFKRVSSALFVSPMYFGPQLQGI